MSSSANLYDLEEYPAHAYLNTHPSRLRTMALLHELAAAPVEQCRVLEIGCNAGANLIPMAHALPGSEFVGFDLAGLPIARGQQRIASLGLQNIRLLQADLMDAEQIPELAGSFDYIVAHGLYTWVPEAVREQLLLYSRKHLAPNGVVFISYATLPGGYARKLTREILQFGRQGDQPSVASVLEGRKLLELVVKSRPEVDGFRMLLEREIAAMDRRGAQAVFHDELAPAYRPVSFHDFSEHAGRHGLRYFSEAEFPMPNDPSFQPEIGAALKQLAGGDPLILEQMLDFARMRMYRESLLCRADAGFTYDVRTEALGELFFTSRASSTKGSTAGAREYTLPGGIGIETQHPMTLRVLEYVITRSPETVSFGELAAHLESGGIVLGPDLVVLLMQLAISRMLDLHGWRAPLSREIAEKPLASGLCRHDALAGVDLVTPLHTVLSNSDAIARVLIPLLDGTRDRETLMRDLTAALPDVPTETLAEGIGPALEVLNRSGVLVNGGR